jgi:diguanylate cyclase (GGDEF)-like protein
MGQLSSAGGIALVVPGYFVCAGILLYTAIIAAVPGLHRGRQAVYLAFAATCLCSAGISFATGSYYLAESVAGAIDAQRWATTASGLGLLSLFVFVSLYTEARDMRRWHLAAALLAVALAAATFTLPLGTRFRSVDAFAYLHLPWGESLFVLQGKAGISNLALRAFGLTVLGWSLWRLRALGLTGQRRDATVLAFYLLVLVGVSFQGAMIDFGLWQTFYWMPFVLVGLAMLMGVNLVIGLRDQNVALARAVRTDELTALPNRRALHDRLQRILASSPPDRFGAVLECDLDHFKVINDALGHEVGDRLLRQVSERLAATARDRALVARVGGNTFMALTDASFATEAEARAAIEALAADLARAIASPFDVDERSLGVAASLGIATFGTREATPAEVIARADGAVELAKRRGRNNLQAFAPQMQQAAEQRFRMVDGLRRAIERGELELRYQPLVDAGARAFGAEALLRWTSADLGEVSPARFIPVAEESGLIHELGEWTLRHGCERLAAWQAAGGFDGYLSVNVSPWQLAHPQFVARLRGLVEAHRIARGRLALEITESAVLFDATEAVAKLREIRALGVQVALDDFGTGYSSLALIKDLPLDIIKIDRSFVHDLAAGANRHLTRVIVAVGAELGLGVIAEGVETAAERESLSALGCSRFQGYLFARPMREPDFLRWLAAAPSSRPGATSVAAE